MSVSPDDLAIREGADRHVRISVPAWDSGVPGLAVTAGIGDAVGGYVLTHEPSGFTFYSPDNGASWSFVSEAREAALRLAGLHDWTMGWDAVVSVMQDPSARAEIQRALQAEAGEPAK